MNQTIQILKQITRETNVANKLFRCVLAAMLFVPSLAWSGEAKLNGKWMLTYDPDGPVTEDWMLFPHEGDVKLGGADGVYLTCPYHLDGDSVILTCKVRGKTIELVMSAKDNYRELVNHTGAVYTRQ